MGPPTVPFQQSVEGIRSPPLVAENNGVAGSVDIHRPRDTEVENNVAFKTNERSREVVHDRSFSA